MSERVGGKRIERRPRVGVSACLLGECVRYDAGHMRDGWIVEALGPQVEWLPVCPEVEIGLGTPREPIRLERRTDEGVALIGIESGRDLTETMRRFGDERVRELARGGLDGYVFKADSPSCGPAGVPIAEPDNTNSAGRGMFADAVLTRLPDLPVADERQLRDPVERDRFVERVFARYRARFGGASGAFAFVDVTRVRGGERTNDVDRAAAEEPLAIRLHGRPFAVIMRTPGADRELAAGFLFAERVIRSADDLGTIEYCVDGAAAGAAGPAEAGRYTNAQESDVVSGLSRTGEANVVSGLSRTGEANVVSGLSRTNSGLSRTPTASNVVNVTLADASADRLERLLADRRNVQTNSSCGLCGRQTIESLSSDATPITASTVVEERVVASLPERLRAAQAVFDQTGGLHAAGLFTAAGELVDVAEDVGRHNAVDKIVGRMLMRERLPLSNLMLFLSGRTSFEIVQKALFAGIPIVAAVSAPSSLAIELAHTYGITLIGFVRDEGFNVYAHTHRVIG